MSRTQALCPQGYIRHNGHGYQGGGDASKETSSDELLLHSGVDLGLLLTLIVLLLGLLGPLLVEDSFLSLGQLGSLSPAEGKGVVSLIPLSKWSGINLHDAVLHEGLRSDQLVVAGVVHNIQDSGLAGLSLRAPGEVASIQSQGTELVATTSYAHFVHAISTKL